MSTAAKVPETWELTGDDARKTLVQTGRLKLVKDAFVRLRAADGFSHARSLAFVTSLVLVQGLVALVGFTVVFGDLRISKEIIQAIQASFPGPVGALLTDAVDQAKKVGGEERYLPLLVGLAGTIITGTTAMGQIERGFNRIYGIEQDRPVLIEVRSRVPPRHRCGERFWRCNFIVFTWGRGNGATSDLLGAASPLVRWPIALVVAGLALGAMLRFAPFRRQPAWSWLDVRGRVLRRRLGARDAPARVFLQLSTSFGETYGPLAGIVALQLWTLFSAIAIFFGAAVAAQLEAVRAGAPEPREEPAAEGRARARGRRVLRVVDPALQRAEQAPVAHRHAGKLDETVRQREIVLQPIELLLGDRLPALVDDGRRISVDLLDGKLEVLRPQPQTRVSREGLVAETTLTSESLKSECSFRFAEPMVSQRSSTIATFE